MIKVLHFVSTPAIWSGVMSVIMNYYRHIDRSKIQFDFLCFIPCKSAQESYEGEIEQLGGRVFFIPKPGSSVRSIKQLKQFFIEQGKNYQWFHNHEVYLSFILQRVASSVGIQNFIIHSHATRYSDRFGAALRNRILCIPIRWMQCNRFACSRDAGEFLFGRRRVERGKVEILYNAIDSKKYAYCAQTDKKLRQEFGLEETFVIGNIGRFVPQKNLEFLLKVFVLAALEEPRLRLVLIGDGPLREHCELAAEDSGLSSRILFLGYRNNVCEFLNMMNLFALPSRFEGIGIALIEAQTNGLPCLASTSVPKAADVTGGVQFLPLQVHQWSQAILRIAREEMDQKTKKQQVDIFRHRDLRETLGKNHYEIALEAERLQKYYENPNTHVNI